LEALLTRFFGFPWIILLIAALMIVCVASSAGCGGAPLRLIIVNDCGSSGLCWVVGQTTHNPTRLVTRSEFFVGVVSFLWVVPQLTRKWALKLTVTVIINLANCHQQLSAAWCSVACNHAAMQCSHHGDPVDTVLTSSS